MIEISLDEKKKLLFSMLTEIDSFCEKNGLTYFLVGGTLLGAIRHNGFIPWDDDIDIGMPRKDYNIFCEKFNSKTVDVVNYRNSPNYIWPAAKAIDNRTILIENGNTKHSIGVFIDVFPFDTIAGDYKTAVKKQSRIQFWKQLIELKYLTYNKDRAFIKNAVVLLGKLLYLIPNRIILSKIEKLSQIDNSKKCSYICNFSGAWGKKEIADISDFAKTEKHTFERGQFSIPVGYDKYLSTLYGDYMTPPPVEKRCSHHGNVAYWKEK